MQESNYIDTLKPLSLQTFRSSDTVAISQYLLGKVLVACIMVELDRVREKRGKGGLSQVPC